MDRSFKQQAERTVRRYRRRPKPIKEKKPKQKATFTKKIVVFLLFMATLWITWSYVLATIAMKLYGYTDPITTLSIQVCGTILGTVIAYAVKSGVENVSQYGYKGKQTDNSDGSDDDVEYVNINDDTGAEG